MQKEFEEDMRRLNEIQNKVHKIHSIPFITRNWGGIAPLTHANCKHQHALTLTNAINYRRSCYTTNRKKLR